ncbi:nuclear transport factor 2 family protein [Bradyrhizobium genosp. P]|uniref:nuclear transport factor 2 family protein n=1 Tax=Bradyrhizobium genosp. P TaxID=83641 RepID=UPI003CF228C0
MPSLKTLQAFADTVESNDHVGAIEKFYAPEARTQENDGEWRVGRAALAAREAAVLASVAGVKTTRLGPLLASGDHSAICWRVEFTGKDGKVRKMEEVAWQTWRGDELIEERFFYDPQQMAR